MGYKILCDSCTDLTPEMASDPHYVRIPLRIFVGRQEFVDDGTIAQRELLDAMKASREAPKTACPSPAQYMEAFDCEADHVYAVTLSANLSGSYNSALLGRNLLLENKPEKKIHVFDSCSAS